MCTLCRGVSEHLTQADKYLRRTTLNCLLAEAYNSVHIMFQPVKPSSADQQRPQTVSITGIANGAALTPSVKELH